MKLLLAFLKFLIKNTNLQIGTVVAQCTTKTTYLKKAIYFFSIMSYSTNHLKSYMLFSRKSFVFYNFTEKQEFCSRKWGWGLTWRQEDHLEDHLESGFSRIYSLRYGDHNVLDR